MQKALLVFVGTALAGVIAVVSAQDIKPDRAIKYRQGILQAQGWHMGNMGAMAKGTKPYNKDDFLRSATYLQQLSHMAWEGFTPGSETGAPTKAKSEIWKEQAKFKQHQDKFVAETPKLVAVAQTGDIAKIRPVMSDVAKACDSCHDDFRSK